MFTLFHRYLQGAYQEGLGRPCWIIGTFPSVLIREATGTLRMDREVDYFYGSAQNRFWLILSELYKEQTKDYTFSLARGWKNTQAIKERQALLASLHLGITDVYAEVQTEGGSSDGDLRNPRFNPYLSTIFHHPDTTALAATSLYAARLVHTALLTEGYCLFARFQNWQRGYYQKTMPERILTLITLPSPSPRNRKSLTQLIHDYRERLSPYAKT
ncbi:MAG: hypothetical protein N2Z76_03740 [Treponemataceae bacterium]|nr:hypothetical protein [Treponemataceae bacterium]